MYSRTYRVLTALTTVAAGASAGLISAALAADLDEIEPLSNLDHMLCYPVNEHEKRNFFRPRALAIEDQFSQKLEVPKLGDANMLCNPVAKRAPDAEPAIILRKDLHMICYAASQPMQEFLKTKKRFAYENQFEGQLNANSPGKLKQLCLPSYKIIDSKKPEDDDKLPEMKNPLSDLDHFSCYDMSSRRAHVRRNISLEDQFGTYKVDVQGPVRLCNPASKRAVFDKDYPGDNSGKPTGRKHKQLHFVCYKITTKLEGRSVRADYHNQFEGKPKARATWGRVRVDAPVELCLPSYKALTSE